MIHKLLFDSCTKITFINSFLIAYQKETFICAYFLIQADPFRRRVYVISISNTKCDSMKTSQYMFWRTTIDMADITHFSDIRSLDWQ